MPNPLQIDPARGFVALPAQVLDLNISPGAFRVLTHLCNLANDDGWCWPSLKQLGEKLNRSKASISSYIAELRKEGVIGTVNQKMASGYNYRLKIQVIFWSEWIGIRKKKLKSVQLNDRRAQNTERLPSEKHKKDKTNTSTALTPSEVSREVRQVLDQWLWLTKGQSYASYREAPCSKLINLTDKVLARLKPACRESMTTVTTENIKALWSNLGVDLGQEDLKVQLAMMRQKQMTTTDFEYFLQVAKTLWKPFWRKPPAPKQLAGMIEKAKSYDQQGIALRVIASHYSTWLKSSSGLPKAA
ncbi:helix-turn-helix domain-containing protein [Ruegeria atlantica]|uniref:helix-turn-helix domain-containing protein n=1 Tax=Ruegeria atlantica TaxID=81569 RepID=UPI00147C5B86|nr:helix-turn-helix domain-containing protein [Ruegeria atlantica]